jgi:hypothetical protein
MASFSPPESPQFQLHSVDVMELNADAQVMGLKVHVSCWEHELKSSKVRHCVEKSVKRSLNYLICEGFIDSVKGWMIHVAIFGHPPKD